MQVRVINSESLDTRGAKVRMSIPMSHDEEPEVSLTKEKYESLGEKAISEIRSVEPNGYFVLKVARILRGFSQGEMAKMLGISLKTYQKRESKCKKFKFTYINAMSIHKELKMSTDTLFFTSKFLDLT